jgi:hypothetical protein
MEIALIVLGAALCIGCMAMMGGMAVGGIRVSGSLIRASPRKT